MAFYTAAVDPGDDMASAITYLRELTGWSISIPQLRHRLCSGEPVVTWDTDDYPLNIERSDHHATIRSQIAELERRGYKLRFQYSPSTEEEFEDVTFEQVQNLLESEVIYDAQEHD